MKLLMENLPASLEDQRVSIEQCLQSMGAAMPVKAVYLFGSHARGEAGPESDVDLCVVADRAGKQLDAARQLRRAISGIWPRPPLTLVPISPARLSDKEKSHDHFFATILAEGVCLAQED